MPTHKDLHCSIHTKDGALQEYHSEDSERDSSKTVYIEAKDAAPFWIEFKSLPGYRYSFGNRVSFYLCIDGEWMGSTIISQLKPHYVCERSYFDGVSKSFQFAEILSLSDTEDHDDQDNDLLDKIGEISVYALRSNYLGLGKWSGLKPQNPSISVSEKKVKGKGLTHTTEFRPCENRGMPQGGWEVSEIQNLETVDEPYVHFRFLYRSRRSLRNLGLIPRTPSPLPPPVEVAEEIARLRAQLESLERLAGASRKMKEEGNSKLRAKRRKLEIIDD